MRRCEVLARKADCITCLYPTESGATTVEAAVMAVEKQAPVGFESNNKRTVFIGSSMTKRGRISAIKEVKADLWQLENQGRNSD